MAITKAREFTPASVETFEIRLDIIATNIDVDEMTRLIEGVFRDACRVINSASAIGLCPSYDTMTVTKVKNDLP